MKRSEFIVLCFAGVILTFGFSFISCNNMFSYSNEPLNDEEKNLIGKWYKTESGEIDMGEDCYPVSITGESLLQFRRNRTWKETETVKITVAYEDDDYDNLVTVVYSIILNGVWVCDNNFLTTCSKNVKIKFLKAYTARSLSEDKYKINLIKSWFEEEMIPEIKSEALVADLIINLSPYEVSLVDEEGETFSMKRIQ